MAAAGGRRRLLVGGPAAAGLAGLLGGPGPAGAGELLEKRRRERDAARQRGAAAPEDQLLKAQEYLLDNEVGRLERNEAFLAAKRAGVEAGADRFVQHAVLRVRDLDAEVRFWCDGMGMSRLRARTVNGARTQFVGYGPESLQQDDGGMFALELVEGADENEVGTAFGYLQLALPNMLRVSRIVESGGDIEYSYGYFEIRAPSGCLVKAYVDNRRDPFELVAFNVTNLDRAVKFYQQAMGMQELEVTAARDSFTPPVPPGSKLLGFGDLATNTSLLLVPAERKLGFEPKPLTPGTVFRKLAILTNDVLADTAAATKFTKREPDLVGPIPGEKRPGSGLPFGTKIGAFGDLEQHGLVYVDLADFQGELPAAEYGSLSIPGVPELDGLSLS